VNEVQGYLLGRPTANPIEDFLRKQAESLSPVAFEKLIALTAKSAE
jgi:hypothetical protein